MIVILIFLDHGYSPCLAERIGESGKSHSKVYGFSLDGFPIYGPYQDRDTLAVSCWRKRVYDKSSATGCADGQRSCLLKDPLDYTKGTVTLKTTEYGPSLTGTVHTLSNNDSPAVSGIYKQDYYFDSA